MSGAHGRPICPACHSFEVSIEFDALAGVSDNLSLFVDEAGRVKLFQVEQRDPFTLDDLNPSEGAVCRDCGEADELSDFMMDAAERIAWREDRQIDLKPALKWPPERGGSS